MHGRAWVTMFAPVLLAACASGPSAEFAALDANRDGYLNAVEGGRGDAVLEHWHALDRNRDGRVSAAEFSALESGRALPRRSSP